MHRLALAVGAGCSLAFLAGGALAGGDVVQSMVNWTFDWEAQTWTQGLPAGRTGTPGPTVYRNLRDVGATFTRNRGGRPAGTNTTMGENLQMFSGGLVTDVWFSAVNGNGGDEVPALNVPAGAVAMTLAFWADSPTAPGTVPPDVDSVNRDPILGGFNLSLPAMPSLTGGTFSVTNLKNLNINLPQNVWVAIQFRDSENDPADYSFAASNYGQVVANQPASTGFSQNNLFRDPFDGIDNPALEMLPPPTIANFNYLVAVAIPAPGAGSALALAGLALLRRSRRP